MIYTKWITNSGEDKLGVGGSGMAAFYSKYLLFFPVTKMYSHISYAIKEKGKGESVRLCEPIVKKIKLESRN